MGLKIADDDVASAYARSHTESWARVLRASIKPGERARTIVTASFPRHEALAMGPLKLQEALEAHGFDFSSGAMEIHADEDVMSGAVAYAQMLRPPREPGPPPQTGPLDLSALRTMLRRGTK